MSAQQHDTRKLSLTQFIWLGFNYTVGIGFIGNLATLSNFVAKDDKTGELYLNTESVGMNIIWIFILLGAVASISALAFAKMAKVHKSDNNGGAYLYTRTAFGRFAGFFTVFMQYIILPFLITIQIFNLLKAFFEAHYSGFSSVDLPSALGKNQHWASLILDLCGIVLYFVFAFVIFGGMKLFKRLSNITGILKWVTSGFLIVAAVYLACHVTNGKVDGASNIKNWFNPSWVKGDPKISGSENGFKLTFNAFSKAFTSCFFFYAGFETFATAGKNIENPEKNLGLGIMLIMLITTVFYILIIVLFVAAIDPRNDNNGFSQNMNMGLWKEKGFDSYKWISYTGVGIMIFSQVALKANVSMQNALYGGTMVQPMSQEGYISEKYNELNKDDLPIKGSNLNFIITGCVLVIWLIIPDLYEGFAGADPVFNVSQLSEASSAITLFVYGMVILAVFKHAIKKTLKLHPLEWIMYGAVLVLFIVMMGYHYYELFDSLTGFSKATNSDGFKTAVGSIVELIFVLFSAMFAIIWYFTYYKSKLSKRLSTDEGRARQAELDDEFVLINNWEFMSKLFSKKSREKVMLDAGVDMAAYHSSRRHGGESKKETKKTSNKKE